MVFPKSFTLCISFKLLTELAHHFCITPQKKNVNKSLAFWQKATLIEKTLSYPLGKRNLVSLEVTLEYFYIDYTVCVI